MGIEDQLIIQILYLIIGLSAFLIIYKNRDAVKHFWNKEISLPDWLGFYKIELVIIKDGINEHITRRVNSFPIKIKDPYDEKNREYNVKTKGLFNDDIGLFKKLFNYMKLIKRQYKTYFWEGQSDPIMRFESDIDPEIIKIAESSRAITNMIKEWFAGRGLPFNKWIFILAVATVGTIIYAKFTGRI